MHQLVGVFPQLAYLFLTSMSGSRMYVLIIPVLEGVSCETEYNNVWKSKLRLAPATGEEPNAERTWRGATRAHSWITNIEQSLKMTETKHFFTNICHWNDFFVGGLIRCLNRSFMGQPENVDAYNYTCCQVVKSSWFLQQLNSFSFLFSEKHPVNSNILSGRECWEWFDEVPTETPQGFQL